MVKFGEDGVDGTSVVIVPCNVGSMVDLSVLLVPVSFFNPMEAITGGGIACRTKENGVHSPTSTEPSKFSSSART